MTESQSGSRMCPMSEAAILSHGRGQKLLDIKIALAALEPIVLLLDGFLHRRHGSWLNAGARSRWVPRPAGEAQPGCQSSSSTTWTSSSRLRSSIRAVLACAPQVRWPRSARPGRHRRLSRLEEFNGMTDLLRAEGLRLITIASQILFDADRPALPAESSTLALLGRTGAGQEPRPRRCLHESSRRAAAASSLPAATSRTRRRRARSSASPMCRDDRQVFPSTGCGRHPLDRGQDPVNTEGGGTDPAARQGSLRPAADEAAIAARGRRTGPTATDFGDRTRADGQSPGAAARRTQ